VFERWVRDEELDGAGDFTGAVGELGRVAFEDEGMVGGLAQLRLASAVSREDLKFPGNGVLPHGDGGTGLDVGHGVRDGRGFCR